MNSAVSALILKSNCCTHTAAAGGTDKISMFELFCPLSIKNWKVTCCSPVTSENVSACKKPHAYFIFHNHTSLKIHAVRLIIQLDILMISLTLCRLYEATSKPLGVPPINIWDLIDRSLGEAFCLKHPQTCCSRNLVECI